MTHKHHGTPGQQRDRELRIEDQIEALSAGNIRHNQMIPDES
jgi:hypothetical protein